MGVLVELVLEVHGCSVAQSAGDNIGPYDRNRRQCRRHFTGLERHLTGCGKSLARDSRELIGWSRLIGTKMPPSTGLDWEVPRCIRPEILISVHPPA